MSLTIIAINHAKPKDKTYRLYDEKGLYLEVTKAGGKLWRLKHRFGGTEKRLAIGPYPEISLEDARAARNGARAQLAAGADPSEYKKIMKAMALKVETPQVLEVNMTDYISKELSKDQWSKVLEKAMIAENSKLHLFLLRSLANQKTVSAGSPAAYKGEVMKDRLDRRLGSTSIGIISTWVRQVSGDPRDTFYNWNEVEGNWMLGLTQAKSLRAALK